MENNYIRSSGFRFLCTSLAYLGNYYMSVNRTSDERGEIENIVLNQDNSEIMDSTLTDSSIYRR